jgi:hypothetical protein
MNGGKYAAVGLPFSSGTFYPEIKVLLLIDAIVVTLEFIFVPKD